jgi:hypothetical protein
VALLSGSCLAGTAAEAEDFLSDPALRASLRHRQDWGDFGLDTAAARPGTKGSPLRIGEQTFSRGLGHHAGGEIAVDLSVPGPGKPPSSEQPRETLRSATQPRRHKRKALRSLG